MLQHGYFFIMLNEKSYMQNMCRIISTALFYSDKIMKKSQCRKT